MAELEFKDLRFEEEKESIKIVFLRNYFAYIDKEELSKIGEFSIENHKIFFKTTQEKAEKKFNFLLAKAFENLTNSINKRKTIYIHKNSNIPLIGTLYFGIVDKGSSMIEIKPMTGCNISCVFCSVDEGLNSRKTVDYLVEDDFIVEELKRLMKYKQTKDLGIYINPHGEPLMYPKIINLVSKIAKLKPKLITIITNGTLLSHRLIDDLIKAGLNQINISINALSDEKAKKIAHSKAYNIEHVKDMINYLKDKIKLVITPVWLKGINDEEIPRIVEFAKEMGCKVGIQNFMRHKHGRKAAKEASFIEFNKRLKELEKNHGIKLVMDYEPVKTKEYPVPFKRGDIIEAEVVFEGRHKNEKIAVAKQRAISIPDCSKKGKVKVKILKSLHNIFIGKSL